MKLTRFLASAFVAGAMLAPDSTLAQDAPKKTRKKPAAQTSDDQADNPDEEGKSGSGKKKKKGAAKKMRAGGIGLLATGMKDAPSPGVFGFGAAFAYGLSRNLEAEASVLSFGYILDYADFDTTIEISDMALGGDAVYRMPLSPTMTLRGRGGLAMHSLSTTVTGTLASTGEVASESKSALGLNIGGGVEVALGRLYLAADIRKPVLFDKIEAVGDISIIACAEAGMRF